MQVRRFDLDSGAALMVAIGGSWANDEMAASGGVVQQPRQQGVVGDQQSGYHQHRQFRGHSGWLEHLAPIVEREALPVTLYVATGHVQSGQPYWFDAVVNAVQSSPDEVRLEWWAAALVLAGYAALLSGFGIWRTTRADIS